MQNEWEVHPQIPRPTWNYQPGVVNHSGVPVCGSLGPSLTEVGRRKRLLGGMGWDGMGSRKNRWQAHSWAMGASKLPSNQPVSTLEHSGWP